VGVALGVWLVVAGPSGLVLSVVAGYAVLRWTRGLDHRIDREDETQRALSIPVALDVLAACFAVGASQERALHAVASGMTGSLGADLGVVAGAMRVGADAAEAWSLVEASDLQAWGAILTRVDTTGAPVTPLLTLLADQHRQRARAVAMDAARALGVRVAGPLGLCFLPAFVLVAVVPLILSLLPFHW
jgi:pilus assembly protein TadC